jgi:hypothetical protein
MRRNPGSAEGSAAARKKIATAKIFIHK